jgi:hypothetical protein
VATPAGVYPIVEEPILIDSAITEGGNKVIEELKKQVFYLNEIKKVLG